jgi:integrase/recombinase XerD
MDNNKSVESVSTPALARGASVCVQLSQAIVGYTLAAQARRLSPHTLADYANTFAKLTRSLGDKPIAAITPGDITAFINAQTNISAKTTLNIYIALSALWTWALKENLVVANIIRALDWPKPEQRAIIPFTQSDLRAMLAALDRSAPYTRPGKRECSHSLGAAVRNRAILLLLLDTGVRASELCELKLTDTDLSNRRILVMGKGKKERFIPLSPSTAQALWRYISTRPTPQDNTDRTFLTPVGRALDRHDLLKILRRIGHRAGVADVHPHRFRHTFAITFLRNGGNAYALQEILGHSSMTMVRRYLALAQTDLEQAHRHASPVSNWNL